MKHFSISWPPNSEECLVRRHYVMLNTAGGNTIWRRSSKKINFRTVHHDIEYLVIYYWYPIIRLPCLRNWFESGIVYYISKGLIWRCPPPLWVWRQNLAWPAVGKISISRKRSPGGAFFFSYSYSRKMPLSNKRGFNKSTSLAVFVPFLWRSVRKIEIFLPWKGPFFQHKTSNFYAMRNDIENCITHYWCPTMKLTSLEFW